MSPPPRSDSFASVGISVVGRLSTQKYPRSSSARMACDFPDPDNPVKTMKGWLPILPDFCLGFLGAIFDDFFTRPSPRRPRRWLGGSRGPGRVASARAAPPASAPHDARAI